MHTGAGSASAEQKFNQVAAASSMMTPRDVRVQDGLLAPETTRDDIPDELQSSKRKGGDSDEAKFYPVSNPGRECYHGPCTKRICQHKTTRGIGGSIDV